MPISESAFRTIKLQLEGIREKVRAMLARPSDGCLDQLLEEADGLFVEIGRVRDENELTVHERELLGVIQLAVAADLAPLEWVEKTLDNAARAWEGVRVLAKDRTGVDLGDWESASQPQAISNAALPLLDFLFEGVTSDAETAATISGRFDEFFVDVESAVDKLKAAAREVYFTQSAEHDPVAEDIEGYIEGGDAESEAEAEGEAPAP